MSHNSIQMFYSKFLDTLKKRMFSELSCGYPVLMALCLSGHNETKPEREKSQLWQKKISLFTYMPGS